ncbi:MAG: hypothetical protein H7Y15_10875 [Pseudonocardia sp.]|nr:hypothetical protein [Pseudonocardia sp.]
MPRERGRGEPLVRAGIVVFAVGLALTVGLVGWFLLGGGDPGWPLPVATLLAPIGFAMALVGLLRR